MMKTYAFAALILLLLAGCGTDVSDNGTMTVDTGAGTLTGSKSAPANLPAYAPAYPGATVVDSVVASQNAKKGGGGLLVMSTNDSADQVMAYYEKAAASAGLSKNHSEPADASGIRIDAFNLPNSKQSFNVTVEPGESGVGTKITLIYQ